MEKFTHLNGLVVPLDRANVDTDAIIPKQFLKSVKRIGFGVNLFDGWRYLDHGEPDQDNSQRLVNPDFVLNLDRYRGGEILLARQNFGCGSSREHAPWALMDYGFRVIIAPGFADIFFNNCFNNGLLAITLDEAEVDTLFEAVHSTPGYRLTIDLPAQTVETPQGRLVKFDISAHRKHRMLHGLDAIDLTLAHRDAINAYEAQARKATPWLFSDSVAQTGVAGRQEAGR